MKPVGGLFCARKETNGCCSCKDILHIPGSSDSRSRACHAYFAFPFRGCHWGCPVLNWQLTSLSHKAEKPIGKLTKANTDLHSPLLVTAVLGYTRKESSPHGDIEDAAEAIYWSTYTLLQYIGLHPVNAINRKA